MLRATYYLVEVPYSESIPLGHDFQDPHLHRNQ